MWCFLEETINDNQLRKRYFQTGEYVNTKNHHCLWLIGWRKMKGADCELHPLIHTFLKFNLAQDLEKKKAEPKTPHFLSLNQYIVPWSQNEKCGLKYVMHSPAKVVECCGESLETSTVSVHSIKYAVNTKRFLSITDCRLDLLEFSAWDKSLLQVQDH
mgnify:CR=1 FL=1